MTKKEIRWNSYKYDPTKTTERNTGEYLVIPDQAYTIEEIFDKFRRGVSLNIDHEGSYTDSDDFNDIDERTLILDWTDIPESIQRMKDKRAKKGVILDSGLPDGGGGKKPPEPDGVKEAGNNSK